MIRDRQASHEIDDREATLLEPERSGRSGYRTDRIGRAAIVDPSAERKAAHYPRHGIGCESLQKPAGLIGVGIDVGRVSSLELAVADVDVPVWQRAACRLDFEALADNPVRRPVGLERQAGTWPCDRCAVDLSQVVLLNPEQGDRRLQSFIEEAALQTDLVRLTLDRIELHEVTVLSVLRQEDGRVACIEAMVCGDVGKDTCIWDEDVLIAVVAIHAVGAAALPVGRNPTTADHLQPVGRVETQGAVIADLLDPLLLVDYPGLGETGERVGVGVPVDEVAGGREQEVAERCQLVQRRIAHRRAVQFAVKIAEHQIVVTTEQRQLALQLRVVAVLNALAVRRIRVAAQPQTRRAIDVAVQVQDLSELRVAEPVVVAGQAPAMAEVVAKRRKEVLVDRGPGGPGLSGAFGPVPACDGAVAVEGRQTAPERPMRLVALMAEADAQKSVVGDVRIEDAVQDELLVAVEVGEGIALLVPADAADAQATVRRDRSAEIARQPPRVPAATGRLEVAAPLALVGMLAHQINGGGRIADAAQKAGGTAHDLNAVVDGHVGDRLAAIAAQRPGGGHAVDLGVPDLEAAREERIAHVVGLVDRDADAVLDHVPHAGQVLVDDALCRDDADRLRCLADRQSKPRRRVDAIRNCISATNKDFLAAIVLRCFLRVPGGFTAGGLRLC